MTASPSPAPSSREQRKADVRARIVDAVLRLLGEGEDVNHDRVAQRAGIARRTVYRYFPDQQALMQPVWACIDALAGSGMSYPSSEAAMLASMPEIFRGFDTVAPLAEIVRATPQGRAVWQAQRDRRNAAYSQALADAVQSLPGEDARLATALFQMLHMTPWLEMRDGWDLDGDRIAAICGWAMQVLLKDLRARGGRPLAEGPA